jgi:hypothetical protein
VRAVVVRCPNCNANLEVAATVASTTCSYCGTVSRIQARTAMFQIPKSPALPKQAPQMTNLERLEQLRQFHQMPIARQPVSILLVLIPFIVLAVVGVGIFFAVRGISSGIRHVAGSTSGKTLWAGHAPAMIDVDGDGVPDPIGILRYVMDNDRSVFAAFSGKTGAPLWESETIGRYSDLGQVHLSALGTLFLVTKNDGTIAARDAKASGAVKWNLSLGEKIAEMCAAGGAEVIVATADDRWWAIDAKGGKREHAKLVRLDRARTDGKARKLFERAGAPGSDVCLSIAPQHRNPAGMFALEHWHDLAKIPGMRVEQIVKRAGGPTIALGAKQPGTSVPMLARIEGERAVWSAEIPAVDPLNARFEAKVFAVSDKAAFALYRPSRSSNSAQLTAFDLATGKRLWDRAFPTGTGFVPTALIVAGDAVLLATWSSLTAFAQSDGSDRYRLGEPVR